VTYLLDANVLIALCDDQHALHPQAHRWFSLGGSKSWATCPLTENAFIRITSHPSYPRSTGSIPEQIRILREFCQLPGHEFWPDDLSFVRTDAWLNLEHAKPSNLTDFYLIALAFKRSGKFVSLDRAIPAHRIKGGVEALQLL
jgi:toxin-antitoxin system PIN domain toxin